MITPINDNDWFIHSRTPRMERLEAYFGGPPPGFWTDWEHDDFIKALEANMLTPIALMKAQLPGMIDKGATITQLHLGQMFRRLIADLHCQLVRMQPVGIAPAGEGVPRCCRARIGGSGGRIVRIEPVHLIEKLVANAILRPARLVTFDDVDATLRQAEDALFTIRGTDSQRGFMPLRQIYDQYLEDQAAISDPVRDNSGPVMVGYTDLDELLGGIQRSDLVILGARPSWARAH